MELTDETTPPPAHVPVAATLEDHLASSAFQARVSALIPKHLSSERFGAICLGQLAKTPALRTCTLESVLGGMLELTSLGLEPGTQGEAWLIPYNVYSKQHQRKVMTAQVQIGVWGHMKLAHNSGRIAGVQMDVVLEGDEWSFSKGTRGHLHHVPRQGRDLNDLDAIRWVYAVVATDQWEPTGDGKTEVMAKGLFFDAFDRAWIERIHKRAQSYDSPAWTDWYAEQAMAKCLKRVLKTCPKSRDLARAITMTDELDAGAEGGQVWDVDTTRLLTADVTVDPRVAAARAAMTDQGKGAGREPEPETITVRPAASDAAPMAQADPEPARQEPAAEPEPEPAAGGDDVGWD
jgi:recombination protein RecT